ncbi:MAG: STAS-like domain-containing protein, partial [Candidatus Acidiferrales bacterium]
NGIGIFKKIQEAFNLPDQRYAILELAKGKLTTDPARHTGEGVFFSSRMFDKFSIGADETWYGHKFGEEGDWILPWAVKGTQVFMELCNHTARTERKIFDQYAGADDDYGFNKTIVPVELAQYGNDKLISRSQAKRVVSRLDLFKTIVFDFKAVPTIGQAFADEIFRVFANEHPQVSLLSINTSLEVKRMIERTKQNVMPTAPIPIPLTD